MKAFIIILFSVYFISCVTPNKIKNKAELDKTIVNNLERELIVGDTIIFSSNVFRCGNSSYAEMLAIYAPLEKPSDFNKLISSNFDNFIYFYQGEIKEIIDSSCSLFKEDSIKCFTADKVNINIAGRCISRRKIRVFDTYRTDTLTRRFDKTFKYKKGNWKLVIDREFKERKK